MFDSRCHKGKWKGRGFKQSCAQTGENAEGHGPPSPPGSPKNPPTWVTESSTGAPGLQGWPAHPKHLWKQAQHVAAKAALQQPCPGLAEPHSGPGMALPGHADPSHHTGMPRSLFPVSGHKLRPSLVFYWADLRCTLGKEEDALGSASCTTFPDEISHGKSSLVGVKQPSETPNLILTNLSPLL